MKNRFPNKGNFKLLVSQVGNMDEKDVSHLLDDGWVPRIKTVKNRKYMTVRKGGKEKSLGPYNEELWNKIAKLGRVEHRLTFEEWNGLKSILATNDDTIAELKAEFNMLKARQEVVNDLFNLAEMVSQCPYSKMWYGQNFCSKYTWEKNPSEIIKLFPRVTFKRNKMNSQHMWRFVPHLNICGSCTKFLEPSYVQKALEKTENNFNFFFDSVALLTESAQGRVRDDHCGCVRIGEDGYCTYWQYSGRRWDRDQKQAISDGKTVYHDNVKKHPEICASCPSFKPRGKQEAK